MGRGRNDGRLIGPFRTSIDDPAIVMCGGSRVRASDNWASEGEWGATDNEVRGLAASSGVVEESAEVKSVEELSRLQQGIFSYATHYIDWTPFSRGFSEHIGRQCPDMGFMSQRCNCRARVRVRRRGTEKNANSKTKRGSGFESTGGRGIVHIVH